jgi:hypothetical protein
LIRGRQHSGLERKERNLGWLHVYALATTTSEIDQEILSFPFIKEAFIIINAIEAMHRLANAATRTYM